MTKEQILATTEYIARLLLSLHGGDVPTDLPQGITLADVYNVAAKHSLAPAAYAVLEDRVRESDLSDSLRIAWARSLDMAMIQQVQHASAFAELTALFSAEAIAFLPIKGFIIKALWNRPELRTMADMDVVVSPEDFDRAGELLLSLGYAAEEENDVHTSYVKGRFIHVELHRTLYDGAKESFSDWTPRTDNPYWYEMSYSDLVSFLIRHAYKHYESGGCGLRTVFDLHLLFEKYGSPAGVPCLMERLNREGLGEFTEIMLLLIDRWFFGASHPEVEQAALYIATGGVYGTFENGVNYSIKKRGGKIRHVLYRVFPPYKAITSRYKWVKKCPILLPIAYIARIFAAIFDRRSYAEMRTVGKTEQE